MTDTKLRRGLSKKRFEEIYQKGARVSTASCRMIALPGVGAIGFATSKAIGNRPQRNRVRRRFNSALTEIVDCIPAGLDLVVQVGVAGAKVNFATVRADLTVALKEMAKRWDEKSECS